MTEFRISNVEYRMMKFLELGKPQDLALLLGIYQIKPLIPYTAKPLHRSLAAMTEFRISNVEYRMMKFLELGKPQELG